PACLVPSLPDGESLRRLPGTTLLAGDGGRILRGDAFNLGTMRCLAVARVADQHAVFVERVEIASPLFRTFQVLPRCFRPTSAHLPQPRAYLLFALLAAHFANA